MKTDPKFENKVLFHEKVNGGWNEKLFRSKNFNICCLGPKNYFRETCAQKTYKAVSLEPWPQFSQTGPHFL